MNVLDIIHCIFLFLFIILNTGYVIYKIYLVFHPRIKTMEDEEEEINKIIQLIEKEEEQEDDSNEY